MPRVNLDEIVRGFGSWKNPEDVAKAGQIAVCVYFPDYMDGINAVGWHLHFVSDDRKHGGHVFDITMVRGKCFLDR